MNVREKLIESLWEYDQMRMMRMRTEECADRLIQKGLTVGKCENDTKCSDLAICLNENAKEKTERIVDLMASFYGVDPGYYVVEAYPLASYLVANGVTVQKWVSVTERLPRDNSRVLAYLRIGEEGRIYPAHYAKGVWWDCIFNTPTTKTTTHWMQLPEPPKDGF